jgi:hypothetical protein
VIAAPRSGTKLKLSGKVGRAALFTVATLLATLFTVA